MTQDAQNVPKYFADFVKQNADEHGQLATEIAKAEARTTAKIEAVRGDLTAKIADAETRTTRWFISALAVGLTLTIAILTFAMTIIVG